MNTAFLNIGPAMAPGAVSVKGTRDFVRRLSLHAASIDRPRLVCRWHRGADDRLACHWEPDTARPADPTLPEFRVA
jgi:hypothetical protein